MFVGMNLRKEMKKMKVDDLIQSTWDQLRSYQKEGIETMLHRTHNLNYDDMG